MTIFAKVNILCIQGEVGNVVHVQTWNEVKNWKFMEVERGTIIARQAQR